MAKRTTSEIAEGARRSARRRSGPDMVQTLSDAIGATDPEMEGAYTIEKARERRAKKSSNRSRRRIVAEVPLKGSIATEEAPRVARLVKDRSYYRLFIGSKKDMSRGKWPARYITICEKELPALEELFAAL